MNVSRIIDLCCCKTTLASHYSGKVLPFCYFRRVALSLRRTHNSGWSVAVLQQIRWNVSENKYLAKSLIETMSFVHFPQTCCRLVREKPLAVKSPPGGILADEMGLGKTVEVLACMLLHTRKDLPPVEPRPVILEQVKVN